MIVRILKTCAGSDFCYTKGTSLDVPEVRAKDLIRAGYAERAEEKKTTAKRGKGS